MDKVNVIGYYKSPYNKEEDGELLSEKLLYFVAYENSTIDGSRKWLEGYNVMESHFEIKDDQYLNECEQITREAYQAATKGWYTPKEYL